MIRRNLFHHMAVSLFVAVSIATATVPNALASENPPAAGAGESFLDGLTLVVLEDGDIPSMHQARELIESHGGHIAIMSPPSLLLGWIPVEARRELAGRAGIAGIYSTEVDPAEVGGTEGTGEAVLSYYNSVIRGEIQAGYDAAEAPGDASAAPAGGGETRKPDRLIAPAFDENSYIENLQSVGLDVQSLKNRGLYPERSTTSAAGNSDYMTGTIALSLFFVESDGTGSDPDMYTWTVEDMQSYVNSVFTALAWWSNRALSHPGCTATFLVYYYSAADPRCQQWSEPILHDSDYEYVWVNEIMSNFGFTSGNRWTRVNAFNTWQRSTYQTARAFSSFIPYNPLGQAPPTFPDGYDAYAYWYGPYSVLLFNVAGWSNAQVFAHETGHIFGACDEYAGGCSSCGTCANGIDNANCESCNPRSVDCMMKANSWKLCAYTPGHVGWGGVVSPCTPSPPPPLPAPSINVSFPSFLYQGLDGTVTVVGSDFYAGAAVDFGEDVFVHTTALVSAETLRVDVTVLNSAPTGLYDVTVTNRDFQSASLSGALEIMPTTHHYYSPSGGNQFPYITPAGASTSLVEAIAAGYVGDTLFVPTMTINMSSLLIERGVLLHGGWNSDFTARDLESGKTVLQLTQNVSIFPGTDRAGLDGFILEGGEGTGIVVPIVARVGGGVRILGSDATIANCEFRFNAASDGLSIGAGGGIFAEGATVDIRDNDIHDNSATWGGGMYLYGCTGTVSGNTIRANTVIPSASTAIGAGVHIVNCSALMFADNTIAGNTGAENGGGLRVENSTGVTVEGGVIDHNAATVFGGGVNAVRSGIVLRDVTIERNAGAVGAGVAAVDTSSIDASGCRFLWNVGASGGGLLASGGVADIHHNLFVGNSVAGGGAAIYVASATAGGIIGNTLDRNTAAGGAGGILLVACGFDVFDNIVVNTTGHGISASGAALPWTGYNLVWNSSGNDYEGVGPGEGAVGGDPAFADTASNDYHLGAHSPAIDAGRPGPAYSDPDLSRGDMGWYGSHDFVMDQPAYPKNLTVTLEFGDVILRWDRNRETDVSHYSVYSDTVAGFKPSATTFVSSVTAADSTFNAGPLGDSTYYVVAAIDADGYASGYSNEALSGPGTGTGEIVYHDRLDQNVPNPFNPSTRIRYELGRRSDVKLVVYDVRGRPVKRLADGSRDRGVHTEVWDGTNDAGERVSTGIYFYRLEAGTFVQTRKMLLLK
jgi:hypothetical protein